MSLKTKELSILAAVAQQCAEARRPISSLIVMAACNARTGIEQDKVLVHLASLKRQGYVTQEGERWEVTPEGHKAARQAMTEAATPSRDPEPIQEKPPVRPKSRDTLRPRQLTAPRPVTRSEPAAVKESFTAATPAPASPGPSSTACDDQELADPWTEGSEMGVTHICPDTRRVIPSPRYAAKEEGLALPMPRDLLQRCAAMTMTLMADAQRRYEELGCPEALSEINWLAKTGRLLLKAGGEV